MTAPSTQTQQQYGYAHRGTVTGPSALDGYWMVRCTAINPARPIGPYPSTVAELAVGDRVLLTAIGTSRDDLVITGRLPAQPWDTHLPIGIGDVTGLQDELDSRATDAELTALQDSMNFGFLLVNSVNDGQDTRLDALEAADSTADGRLDALEAADTALDGRLDTAETSIADHTSDIADLQAVDALLVQYSAFNTQHEVDVYGDQISAFPRVLVANFRTLTANGGLGFRTRVRKAISVTTMRCVVVTAGSGGGTTTFGLYRGSAQHGAYTLAGVGSNALSSTGEANISIGTTPIAAGEWVLLLIRAAGYSSYPQIATIQNQVRNSAHNPSIARAAFPTRTTSGAFPSSIDTTDGTWTASDPTPWWVAAA